MILAGIGIVFTGGRGLDAFESALRTGGRPPQWHEAKNASAGRVPVHAVDDETLRDRSILAGMRRADRFTRMSVLAAADALADGQIDIAAGSRDLGILLATGLGAHVTAFRFLDEMLEHGEAAASPTLFSRSVQNAAASHIALHLEAHGPTMTLTQFHLSFHQALLLASAWLREGRCARVLVGATEECGAVMEWVCRERIRFPPNGRLEPLRFGPAPEAVPGEGSVFFLLTREEPPRRYAEIRAVVGTEPSARPPDLVLADADGLTPDETAYRRLDRARPVAAYSPLYGSMMTGTAFQCAAGALMLRDQVRFPCPATENPLGLRSPAAYAPAALQEIELVRHPCDGEPGIVRLSR